MCLGAIYWARPKAVYFACNKSDASAIGFDDSFIYKELEIDFQQRKIPMIPFLREEGLGVFKAWEMKSDRIEY